MMTSTWFCWPAPTPLFLGSIVAVNPTSAGGINSTIVLGHADPVPNYGYWAAPETPDVIIACIPSEACLGGKGAPCGVGTNTGGVLTRRGFNHGTACVVMDVVVTVLAVLRD